MEMQPFSLAANKEKLIHHDKSLGNLSLLPSAIAVGSYESAKAMRPANSNITIQGDWPL